MNIQKITQQKYNPTTQRNSAIELLKILAIIIIVISHSLPITEGVVSDRTVDIRMASDSIVFWGLRLFRNLGQIGNDIFIICSAWFLLESRKVNIKKVAYLIGDCVVISVSVLAIFLIMGYDFRFTYIIRQFIPITLGNNWFVTCYLIFLAIHPLMNLIIGELSQKKLLLFDLFFFVMYCCLSFVMWGELFFYNRLIGFIGVYFIVAYVKKYLVNTSLALKNNIVVLVVGIMGWLAMDLFINNLGLKISGYAHHALRWNQFINPCFILIAFALFNICRRFTFHNKWINYLSGVSLFVYILTDNGIIQSYLKLDVIDYIKTTLANDNLLICSLIYAGISGVISIVISVLYQVTLQRLVKSVFGKLCDFTIWMYEKFTSYILRLN